MKCREAIERDAFECKYPSLYDPTTLEAPEKQRQYLKNRLDKTFLEGVRIGKGIAAERIAKGLKKIIDNK